LLAAGCAFCGVCRAAAPPVLVAPPSAWIAPLRFQAGARAGDSDTGRDSRLLLEDCQINPGTNEVFNHVARQLWSAEGVQNHSHLSIDFDTNHQSLILHWVRVWRGTNALDRLDLTNLSVIQRERDLDQYLFSGEQSAVLVLEDVRAGDILDYAYTIRGADPASPGKFSRLVTVREHEPADRLTTRLLWPRERRLYIKKKGTESEPAVVRKGDVTEYTWDCKNTEGVEDENPLPVWYYPLPWVQLSEFQTWADVNQWELTVFTNRTPLSPELTRQIALWRALPDAGQRVLAVLRFMQEEVRYQGIETGAAAYTPASPSLVFGRRFGDCKDKTLCCVTILRALGMEAWPVLVATDLRQTLRDWLPTAGQFDHAIVQVSLDGATYWLDPTAAFQRGPLAARSWPNYGCGLVVRPGTTGLADIPESPVRPKTTVTEYFFIRLPGQPTDLKVVTVADGPDAEMMRKEMSTDGRAAWQTRVLNDFAALYPDIELAAPLDFLDNEERNEVVTTEYYQIGRMWNPTPLGVGWVCRFYPGNIQWAARKPAVSFRSMPLGVAYPKNEVFRAEITSAQVVPVDFMDRTIAGPAFFFHKIVAVRAGKILLEEDYNSLTDAVPVEAMPEYLRQLGEANDLIGFSLFSN
jgi:transglutaminase-like putative cysteine protease